MEKLYGEFARCIINVYEVWLSTTDGLPSSSLMGHVREWNEI